MPTRRGTRCLLVSAADVGAGSGSLITRSAESKLMWIRPGPNRYWPQANSAPEKLGSCQYPSLATAGRVQVFDKTFLLLLHWEPHRARRSSRAIAGARPSAALAVWARRSSLAQESGRVQAVIRGCRNHISNLLLSPREIR